MVANGTLTGHRSHMKGNTNGSDDDRDNTQTDTLMNDIEALKMLWVKEDTSWDTTAVFGDYRKKLCAFSADYRDRK